MQISFVLIAGSGLVIDWEQESGRLLASGDVRYIRVWDSTTELKLQVRHVKKYVNYLSLIM